MSRKVRDMREREREPEIGPFRRPLKGGGRRRGGLVAKVEKKEVNPCRLRCCPTATPPSRAPSFHMAATCGFWAPSEGGKSSRDPSWWSTRWSSRFLSYCWTARSPESGRTSLDKFPLELNRRIPRRGRIRQLAGTTTTTTTTLTLGTTGSREDRVWSEGERRSDERARSYSTRRFWPSVN